MSRSRWLLPCLLALAFAGCTKGGECDTCTSDKDCQSGFICVKFTDSNNSSVGTRCGSGVGATTCRVR